MRLVVLLNIALALAPAPLNAQTRSVSALFPIQENGKHGYDKSGRIVIEPSFAEAEQFSDGVAIVRVLGQSELPQNEQRYKSGSNIISVMPGKFGVVDRNGKIVLPAQFVQFGNFSNGLAWVNLGNDYIVHGDTDKWGYINKSGKFVWTSTKTQPNISFDASRDCVFLKMLL